MPIALFQQTVSRAHRRQPRRKGGTAGDQASPQGTRLTHQAARRSPRQTTEGQTDVSPCHINGSAIHSRPLFRFSAFVLRLKRPNNPTTAPETAAVPFVTVLGYCSGLLLDYSELLLDYLADHPAVYWTLAFLSSYVHENALPHSGHLHSVKPVKLYPHVTQSPRLRRRHRRTGARKMTTPG